MQDKLNMLSMGEKLVVGGGVLLLIASFLPWYDIGSELEGLGELAEALGADVPSFTRNGWQSPGGIFSILALLIGLAMAGSIIAVKFGNMQLPATGNFTLGQVYLAAGGAVAVLIVLKLLNETSYIAYGFFLGIIAAGLLAAGGYFIYTEEKASVRT